MHYPSRAAKLKVANENIEDEVFGDVYSSPEDKNNQDVINEITTEVVLNNNDDVNALAQEKRESNAEQADTVDIAKDLDNVPDDLTHLERIKQVATEALDKGGLSLKNGAVLNCTVNSIARRYGLPNTTLGLENFIYDDTRLAATESLIDKTIAIIDKLATAIGKAASELADTLISSIKRTIRRASVIKNDIDTLRNNIKKHSDLTTLTVPLLDSVAHLRINGEVNVEACMALAGKEMNISSIAESWKGLWARGGKNGAIYKLEFQEQTGDFIEPLSSPAVAPAIKAIPSRLREATPVNVSALPGDVYVATVRKSDGVIYSGWSEANIPVATDKTLPQITDVNHALKVLDAAYTLAHILDTKLSGYIKASDSVQAAAEELARVKNDFQPTPEELKQASANVDAAYAFENAIVRSVWNCAEGLLMYVKKSVVL